MSVPALPAHGSAARSPSRWRWLKLFAAGAVAWAASVLALAVTRDPNLIPVTVVLGRAAVPVATAFFVNDRLYDGTPPAGRLAEASILGATLGLLLAATIECGSSLGG